MKTQSIKRHTLPRNSVEVVLMTPRNSDILFKLIDRNREHLSQWDDETAQKYPNHESLLESIYHPSHPTKKRYYIWDGNTMVGSINLMPRNDIEIEVEYWIGREYCGKGFATEALRVIVTSVQEQGEYPYMTAWVRKENYPSQQVLEKVGFEEVGEERFYLFFKLKLD